MNKIWDDTSIEILKEKFSSTNVEDLEKILPFTARQINKKANSLGLKKGDEAYKHGHWSDEDTEILVTNYESKTTKEISELLNGKFSEQQIRNKISRLGLSKRNKWTSELEEYLLDNFKNMTVKEMKNDKLNDFTENAIYKKLNKLGVTISNNVYWNEDEELIMKQFYPLKTNEEMMELLPRFTRTQIKEKARNMRLKKLPLILYKTQITTDRDDLWTDEEVGILIEHYGKIPNNVIRDLHLPNRSVNAIKKKANKLQLKDSLRYEFEWKVVNAQCPKEEPNSVIVTVEKRRKDK